LEGYLKKRLGTARVKYRWSGQIIEPVDGLPYIGRNSLQSQVYVATGYAGNGITFGTLAGLILSDLILARPNRYAEVYAATRLAAISSVGTYIRENVAFPATLAADRLTNADVDEGPVGGVARGEGKILVVDGAKTAVSRDEHGRLQGVSAVCTHLGCDVRWNDSEKTWDCPCHGSRFSRDGRVLNGPAVAPLKPVDLTSAAIKS
jgi:nitrite reductase/ring-hydroxylating ferredoxin subunit